MRVTARLGVGRRALASIGAAGIMVAAGGFVVSSSCSTAQQAQQALPELGPNGFSMESGHEWAYRANLTLASLSRQIDELTLADQQWRTLGWADPTLPVVRDLHDRLTLLNQQRTVLLAQLAAWESLQRSQGDLAAAEAQLARAERGLRESPIDTGSSPQAVAAYRQLVAIRDLRREQRDGKVAERDSLQRAVATALHHPVPDEPGRTTAAAGAVRDLDRQPAPPPPDAQHRQVPAVPPRDGNGDRPRAEVADGAPPRCVSGDDLLREVTATGGDAVDRTTSGVRDVGNGVIGGSGGRDPGAGGSGGGANGPVETVVHPGTPERSSPSGASPRGTDTSAAPGSAEVAGAAIAYGMSWAAATGYPSAGAADSSDSSDGSDYPSSTYYSSSSDSSDSSDSGSSSSDSGGSSSGSVGDYSEYVDAAYSLYEASSS